MLSYQIHIKQKNHGTIFYPIPVAFFSKKKGQDNLHCLCPSSIILGLLHQLNFLFRSSSQEQQQIFQGYDFYQ